MITNDDRNNTRMAQNMNIPVILVCIRLFEATHAIVSDNFRDCRDSFFNETPPELRSNVQNEGKCLCNRYRYGTTYYFATSYDTIRHIPFYSAYKLTQVRRPYGDDNNRCWRKGEGLGYYEQPRNIDFKGVGRTNLNRGHLAPRQYFSTVEGRKATDVLTNVGLQYREVNQLTWRSLEQRLLQISSEQCHTYGGETYFITGVVPSNVYFNWKISIPHYFWTAVCCDTSKLQTYADRFKGWSFAYMVKNTPELVQIIELFTIRNFLNDKRISSRYVTLFDRISVPRKNSLRQYVDNCLFDSNKADEIIYDLSTLNGLWFPVKMTLHMPKPIISISSRPVNVVNRLPITFGSYMYNKIGRKR